MPGIENLLRGILSYRKHTQEKLLKQFKRVKDNPEPTAVFFTCIDSRVLATKFTDSQVGENLIIRSAGNLVPHSCNVTHDSITTDPGALELGCLINDSKHVVVCGHSDCKAMNLLYDIKEKCLGHGNSSQHKHEDTVQNKQNDTHLQLWLKKHGSESLKQFMLLTPENSFMGPLTFRGETPDRTFKAYIDPENKFSLRDKLSQVNCLQQIENIASYPFLKEKLISQEVKLHAMWFDVYSGEVSMFSRVREKFVQINENTFEHLLHDARRKFVTGNSDDNEKNLN